MPVNETDVPLLPGSACTNRRQPECQPIMCFSKSTGRSKVNDVLHVSAWLIVFSFSAPKLADATPHVITPGGAYSRTIAEARLCNEIQAAVIRYPGGRAGRSWPLRIGIGGGFLRPAWRQVPPTSVKREIAIALAASRQSFSDAVNVQHTPVTDAWSIATADRMLEVGDVRVDRAEIGPEGARNRFLRIDVPAREVGSRSGGNQNGIENKTRNYVLLLRYESPEMTHYWPVFPNIYSNIDILYRSDIVDEFWILDGHTYLLRNIKFGGIDHTAVDRPVCGPFQHG